MNILGKKGDKPRTLMGGIFHFIGRKQREKSTKAIAFVDYENWYYSYQKRYHLTPDLMKWRNAVEKKFVLEDIMVFGNFLDKGMREELAKIRCVSNSIIETQQTISGNTKDITDFVMLDYIYQYVIQRPEIENYIILSGDAHFQFVVKYLRQQCNKRVIVYGVRNAFSTQLEKVATEAIKLPADEEFIKGIYLLIVDNMNFVFNRPNIIPTFNATVRAVSKKNSVDEDIVRAALTEMINSGLLYYDKQRVKFNETVNVVKANWDRLIEAGLWKC